MAFHSDLCLGIIIAVTASMSGSGVGGYFCDPHGAKKEEKHNKENPSFYFEFSLAPCFIIISYVQKPFL